MDTTKLDEFLREIVDLASRVHKCPKDDIKVQYRIIEDEVLLAVDCPQKIVITTIAWNFEEHLKEYVPGAKPDFVNLLDQQVCHNAEAASLFTVKPAIDAGRAVDAWEVLGSRRILHVRTVSRFLGAGDDQYMEKLKTNGFDPERDSTDWKTFEAAYVAVIGTTPLETLREALKSRDGRS